MEDSIEINHGKLRQNLTRATPELQGLAGWILRLLRSRSRASRVAQKQLHLVETLSLSGKNFLLLVECAGERFLVGGGPESVQTIVSLQNGRPSNVEAEYKPCR